MIEHIYTTYIKTTPEKIWQAITMPEFTKQYWSNTNVSDWKKGSKWEHVSDEAGTRITGKVVESQPPKLLVLTWAEPQNLKDESEVKFEIEKLENLVRLTVTHSKLSADMGTKINNGWPLVLSNLKTFLESGKPMGDIWAIKKCG